MNDLSDNEMNEEPKPIPKLPKPKPFHITEPHEERGLWCFWLTADDDVLQFVHKLNCIIVPSFGRTPFGRRLMGRTMFAFNPRYDHEETWLWLHEVLDSESKQIELSENWEDAIRDAHISSNET
ncbi:MAG: hypothetical protein WBC91_12010 [Phototrophicaceae bacterium]